MLQLEQQSDDRKAINQTDSTASETVKAEQQESILGGQVTYADAQALVEANEDEDAILPQIQSSGTRGIAHNLSRDKERSVRLEKPKVNPAILTICRNSKNETEGGTIRVKGVEKQFGIKLKSFTHGTQITIILANKIELMGYIRVGEKSCCIYLPYEYIPEGFQLPISPNKQPVKVSMLLIG